PRLSGSGGSAPEAGVLYFQASVAAWPDVDVNSAQYQSRRAHAATLAVDRLSASSMVRLAAAEATVSAGRLLSSWLPQPSTPALPPTSANRSSSSGEHPQRHA